MNTKTKDIIAVVLFVLLAAASMFIVMTIALNIDRSNRVSDLFQEDDDGDQIVEMFEYVGVIVTPFEHGEEVTVNGTTYTAGYEVVNRMTGVVEHRTNNVIEAIMTAAVVEHRTNNVIEAIMTAANINGMLKTRIWDPTSNTAEQPDLRTIDFTSEEPLN